MALFERFTERARQVVILAQTEARTLKHDHVGTEHLLLGLVHEDKGVAARALGSFDVTLERTRGEVVRVVGVGDHDAAGQIPFTPLAKKVLAQALHEALVLGHNYIGTEHLLLGLISVTEGPSVRILADMNVAPEAVRSETLRIIAPSEPAPTAVAREAPAAARSSEEWFHIGPGSHARRLLMLAASRALADGRSMIEPTDVLLAMTRDEDTGPLLAELGVDEAAVVNALRKRRPPNGPPQA